MHITRQERHDGPHSSGEQSPLKLSARKVFTVEGVIFPTSESAQGVKGQKGFTLTELLTVIAILGVLAAIAIPAFLSQRERARYRVMEADARGAVGEVQAALDGYHNRLPMVFLTEPEKGTCFEHATASNQSNKSCAVIYPGYPARSYSTLADVMDALATHYNTGREKNPLRRCRPALLLRRLHGHRHLRLGGPSGNL